MSKPQKKKNKKSTKEQKDKELELLFVTKNVPSIHFAPKNIDYIHTGPFNEAWSAEVIDNSSFVERWLAERDKSILQFIPYIICTTPSGKVFSYSRKGGGEGRLEGKKSIGIGGHVNIDDKLPGEAEENKTRQPNTWDIVTTGAVREATEELHLDSLYVEEHIKQVGIIHTPNDGEEGKITSSPKVGEVHIGIIYLLDVEEDLMLQPNEGMINPCFISNKPSDLANFEFWSRLCLNHINQLYKV